MTPDYLQLMRAILAKFDKNTDLAQEIGLTVEQFKMFQLVSCCILYCESAKLDWRKIWARAEAGTAVMLKTAKENGISLPRL